MSNVSETKCLIDEINNRYNEIDKAREERLNVMFDKVMSDQKKSLEKLDKSVNKFDNVCKNLVNSTKKVSKKINRISINFIVFITLMVITLIVLVLLI